MEKPINLNLKNVYEVKVQGDIDTSWLTNFGVAEVHTEAVEGKGHQATVFKVDTDQTGLVGVLRRMHGLGIVLLSIRLVNTSNT